MKQSTRNKKRKEAEKEAEANLQRELRAMGKSLDWWRKFKKER